MINVPLYQSKNQVQSPSHPYPQNDAFSSLTVTQGVLFCLFCYLYFATVPSTFYYLRGTDDSTQGHIHTKQGLSPELAPCVFFTLKQGSLAPLSSRLYTHSVDQSSYLYLSPCSHASSPPPPFCGPDAILCFKYSLLLCLSLVRRTQETDKAVWGALTLQNIPLKVFLSCYFLSPS